MKREPFKTIGPDSELTPLDSTQLADANLPRRVLIAPWGDVESTSGAFNVDEESVRLVMDAFNDHGTDLPIDYEHQTLGGAFSSPTGLAPAAGWIKGIESEPGVGIFADVEWTEPAKEQLAAKQYRYLSPVAVVRKNDRKLIGLHSVALTNKPAIVGAEPIVNRVTVEQDAPHAVAMEALRVSLDLDDACDTETILVAAHRQLQAFEAAGAKRAAADRVRRGMSAGKITPAQRDFAIDLACSAPALFDRWLDTGPVVVPLGKTPPPDAQAVACRSLPIASRARAEYHASPTLQTLTSEQAFVADALRSYGKDG
jgi:phage I-like protein